MPLFSVPPHLITLGRLALIDSDGNALISGDSAKRLAILAYLSASPGRRATRDHLIDLFWADSEVDKARNSLRQSLHKLRAAYGDKMFPGDGTTDIVLSTALTTDRDAFLSALDTGDFDRALVIYAGPFAPGIVSAGSAGFEQWADNERERLHDLFAAAVETVAHRLIAKGEPRAARTLAQRLLDMNPLAEKAWRLRLEAETAFGSRVHIAATVAELQRQLAQDNRQPEPRTRQLLERLTRATEQVDDDDGKPTLVADLVGREAEFGQLYRSWRSAVGRRASHLHVTAPAGVGKTRLLDAFAFRLEAERARVLRVRATPRQRTVSASVLACLVSSLVDLPGATGVADRSARILVDLQPSITTRFANSAPLETIDSGERSRMRTEALVDLLKAVCDEAPLCVLLDDVHWWDSYSRDLIADVIERMAGKAVLVVTASRPGPGEVTTAISANRISLKALDTAQIVALLASLGESPDAPAIERLASGLQTATAGVPLLILEALRLGIDRGSLCLGKSGWAFGQLDDYLLSLRPGAVLAERIAALTPAQRNLLLLAAVIEMPVNEGAAATLGIDAPGETAVDLERHGLLAPQISGWVTAHDVIALVAIETSAPADLRHAHNIAGEFLATTAKTRVQYAEAARHFLDAGDLQRVANCCGEWVRHRRTEDDDRGGVAIVRELLGPIAGPPTIAAVIRALPSSVQNRLWRKRVFWPAAAVIAVTTMGVGWWAATKSSKPDAEVGIFVGPSGDPAQFAVPIRTDHWGRNQGQLVPVPATSTAGYFPGRPTGLNAMPVAAPDGRRWLVSRIVAGESGPTELYLIDESGRERPIAPAPGDDVNPDWSPDGRSAVFMTARWSPHDDADFNLGIVDVGSGNVRRLTRGRSSDEWPRWSPDGTRIAFLRRPTMLAQDELCWITANSSREYCRTVAAGIRAVVGWLDQRTVIAEVGAGGIDALTSFAVDSDQLTTILTGRIANARLSPDAGWLICDCSTAESPSAGVQLVVFPVHQPEAHRSVRGIPVSGLEGWFWYQSSRKAWLSQLRIVLPPDSIAVDAAYRMSVVGTASDGSRLDPPDAVLAWRSSDSSVATVDSITGDLHPRRPGSTWISAFAGGWRSDSLRILITGPATSLLFHEDWTASWRERWAVFGPDPKPQVVSGWAGGHAFTPNGNGTYANGAFSRDDFPANAGLGAEAIVETPITRTKWQRISLGVASIDRAAPAASDGPAADPPGAGCATVYPSDEGWSSLHLMSGAATTIQVADTIASGAPYRLRLQLFADGSCGVAINGRAIFRSRHEMPTDHPVAVILRGESVGTKILVGALTVWRGVRGDVDWSALDRTTTKERTRGKARAP